MRTIISILGCGWLGSELGKNLLSKGYIVKGSTGSASRYNDLEFTGIQPFYIWIEPGSVLIDYHNFFNTDVLVIAIPPGRMDNIMEVFPQQIDQIIQFIRKLQIRKVLFVSSTSVYEASNKIVREGEEENPEKLSGRAILLAEKLLQQAFGFQTTVVRFGGLIGADRNPARFLAGKKNVSGSVPVNLIHRIDCINIITEIIEKNIWGETFNACCPIHPTKKEFYTRASEISELPLPEFVETPENYKEVNSDKLINQLGYTFQYPSPMDYLKELQEWVFRI
jgi:nucleoside-diphosphate-sugar epimerase